MLGFIRLIFSRERRSLAAQDNAKEIIPPKVEIEEECWRDTEQIIQPIIEIDEQCRWDDIVTEEILLRFPANHLQKLKSVCRNWFTTISCPCFARLHLKIYNQSRIRVLIQRNYEMIEYNINSSDEESKRIPHPPAIRKRRPIILGSCDGLLCLLLSEGASGNRTIAVYNPSTGKYFKVKLCVQNFHIINCCWFGHHPSSGEYVLVLGNLNWEVGVYNFTRTSNLESIHSTSRWKISGPVIYGSCEKRGVLLHGALHWAVKWNSRDDGNDRYIICVYHLGDNKYFGISPPVQCCDFRLGVAEGCLFAVLKKADVFELWMMKEYRVEQSWTKCADIQGFDSCRVLSPLGFFPNGDLILDVDNLELIKYSFDDNKSVHLMSNDTGSEVIMCADSLVSPTIFGGGGVDE